MSTPRARCPRWVALSGALLLLLEAGSAAAAEDDARAKELYKEGRALLRKKAYNQACERLAESQRLVESTETLSHLASCNEIRGRTATAWQQYLDLAALAAQAGEKRRQRRAEKKARRLEDRLMHVRIEVADPVPGLKVSIGGRELLPEEYGTAVPADPGEQQVKATAEGYEPFTKTVSIEKNRIPSLTIPKLVEIPPPKPEPVAAPPPPPPAPPDPEEPEGPAAVPPLAIAAFGVGAVGLGVGAFFGLRASSKDSDAEQHCSGNTCNQTGFDLREEAIDAAQISTIGFIVGVVGVGAGTYFVLSRPKSNSSEVAVGVRSTGSSTMLVGRGRF